MQLIDNFSASTKFQCIVTKAFMLLITNDIASVNCDLLAVSAE